MKEREFIRNEMERGLFKTGLIISMITVLLLMLLDIFYLKHYVSVLIEGLALAIFITFYYFSNRNLYSSRLIVPYLIFIFILLDLGWYFGGGFITGVTLLFFVAFTLSLIMAPINLRTRLMIVAGLNFLFLMIVEFMNPEIREIYEKEETEMITSYVFIFITFSLSIYLVIYMKDNYEKVREKLSYQNLQLNVQSADLHALNKKLEEANELLEKKVMERTARVEEKKRKILDYAFMNSHHVRAPLVNIIGLANLYDNKSLNDIEKEELMTKIKAAAAQLNLEFEMVKGHIEKEDWGEV